MLDFVINLQLGEVDDIINMRPLDRNGNRNIDSQSVNQIKVDPDGPICETFTIIKWRKEMFDNFLRCFGENSITEVIDGDPYEMFIKMYEGKQFGNGLFNVFYKTDIEKWTAIVGDAYPEVGNVIKTFGYDWLGRIFAIDETNVNRILMFEIGTKQILEISCPFLEFLNKEIPLHHEACFATSFYSKWLRKKKIPVVYGRCIGYKIPLFLGGKDHIRNMEDSDMEVYWHILSQIK